MLLTTDRLIEEFYELNKEKYSNLSKDRIEKICKMPFYFIRSRMEDNSFPLIHIKYLGKFLVYPGKVKAYVKGFNKKLSNNNISVEDYDIQTKPLKDYLILNNEEVPNTIT